jgi:type IV pilus assembly protein PilM
LDFSILYQPAGKSDEQKMLVYLVAASKKYLQAMVDFLVSVGLEPIAVESEMVAVSRAFTYGSPGSTTLIAHMGAMSTVLAIVDGNSLTFSYVTELGGVALTRSLSQSLALPLPQAEEYKRTYGLDSSQMEGKVRTALLVVLDTIVSEIRKAMEYHLLSRKTRVTRIVLSGGGAYLPQLSAYLSEVFGGIEVVVGDPLAVAKPSRGITIPRERAVYSVAVGLSQRVF